MTTTTFETYTVEFETDSETWNVIDSDGDAVDNFAFRSEAEAEAASLTRNAEIEWLSEQIQERIAETAEIGGQAGLDALRAMASFVGGIR